MLWFGTRGGGLNCINMKDNSIKSLEDMDSRILLTNNDVLCLLRDDANIWIGTSYGLNELKKEENDFRLIQYADEKLNNKNNSWNIKRPRRKDMDQYQPGIV